VLSQPNTEHTTKAVGAPPEPVMGAGALQDFALSDPFLTPSVVTARMYRDLVTGVAKAHLPEAAPLHFPDGYFGRLNAFQSEFGLKFNQNELLLRALTHRSHAINWLEPRESKREGWWRSPAAVATVQKYDQVINVVSNASMASLGLSLMFFLTQSYLFQKHPTLSSSALARESRALCAAPLLASLGSAHFLLTTNKLVLCDARGPISFVFITLIFTVLMFTSAYRTDRRGARANASRHNVCFDRRSLSRRWYRRRVRIRSAASISRADQTA
jgi:hypothetical protein